MNISEAQYIQQQRELGSHLHLHDGVWWERVQLLYAKPAYEFRAFPRGAARPDRKQGIWCYSHQVASATEANRMVEFMVLDGDDLRQFSLQRLDGKKRNQVRKGLKHCEVRVITDLDACLEDVRLINIDHALRQMGRGRFAAPPTAYTTNVAAWMERLRHQFGQPGRVWWGAFDQGRLAAYMVTYQVETKAFIQVMKTHGDYLSRSVTDAVYFCSLEQFASDESCVAVINSGPARDSLRKYKEQFLFKLQPTPYYVSHPRLLDLGLAMHRIREGLRMAVQKRLNRGPGGPKRPAGTAMPERERAGGSQNSRANGQAAGEAHD